MSVEEEESSIAGFDIGDHQVHQFRKSKGAMLNSSIASVHIRPFYSQRKRARTPCKTKEDSEVNKGCKRTEP
jgi:hypothetical protein